jgi:hypothetical protein
LAGRTSSVLPVNAVGHDEAVRLWAMLG